MIIGVIGFVEVREDWQEVQRGNWAQTTRVIWAISMFFIIFYYYFYLFFVLFFFTNLYLQVLYVLWSYRWTYRRLQQEEWAQTSVYCVIWAIHKFFYIIICVF